MAIPGNLLSQVTESVDPNTSGWTAMLNATISLGTGGRNGDGVLAVKSIASGEMRARTVSSYVVTPGVLYEAFADAAGTVTERIGIRWLTAAGAEISITWSLSTTAASASLHRIAVAGPAPVTAARAQVVVSATPAAANITQFFENAYLGQPIRTLGNLLEFNTETPDVDTSGWVVDSNCTISRQMPAVQWPIDYYLGGGHTMVLTVTANGNAAIKTAAAAPATAGREYVAWGYLNPPTTAAATWIELRFVNAVGTVLGTQRSQLAAASTGWMRQIASAPAPAGTTGVVVAVGITAGTAAQVVRADSIAVLDAATLPASGLMGPIPTGQVVSFGDCSFEQGVGQWAVTSGTATAARSSPWGALFGAGSYSLKVTCPAANASTLTSGRYPVTGGLPWQLSYALNIAAVGWTFQDFIVWRDAAGATISTGSTASYTLPSAGWWVITSDYTAPAGAATAQIQVQVTSPSAGAITALDLVTLVQTLPITELEVVPERASVTLTHRQLTIGQLLYMWRVDQAGHRTPVRGPVGLMLGTPITAETWVIEDAEAPLGVPVSYYSEVRDTAGALKEQVEWATVTVPAPDINSVWIKDPSNPQRNLLLMVPAGGAPDWQRPLEQASYVVKGRRNKVTHHGIRQGREGDLTVWTRTPDEQAALDHVLDSGADLLIQSAAETGIGSVYVSVGPSTEVRGGQDSTDPWRTWTLPCVEADMPTAVGIAGAGGRTWQDILSEFDTWGDVLDTYASWEDVFLDRRRT
jgi:hypothetical protein